MKRKATVYLNILIFLAVFSGLLTGCTGVKSAKPYVPEGSALEVIEGGSHVVLVEKPFYHDFQDRLIRFLEKPQD